MTIGCLCLRRRLFLLVLRPTAALRFLPVPPDFPLRASQSDFQRLSGRRLRRTPPVIDFGPSRAPSRPVLRPLLTSHGEPSSVAPFGAASVRSSRVGARSFPSCSCLIYGSCSSARVCLQPPSACGLAAHALLVAMELPLPAPPETFTHWNVPMPGTPRKTALAGGPSASLGRMVLAAPVLLRLSARPCVACRLGGAARLCLLRGGRRR